MPRRYTEPNEFVSVGGAWPHGPFQDDTPAYALVTAALVRNVEAGIGDLGISNRALARASGLDAGSVSRLLAGHTIPDLATVVALEIALDRDLWPDHR